MSREEDQDQRRVRRLLADRPAEGLPDGFAERLATRLDAERATPKAADTALKKKAGSKRQYSRQRAVGRGQ